jgi:serine/threonine-protein kinase
VPLWIATPSARDDEIRQAAARDEEGAALSHEIDGLQTVYAAPTEPARALADGDRFADRYRVERRLGSGGMGVVYLADDELSGEHVALKLIHPSLVDTKARQRMI